MQNIGIGIGIGFGRISTLEQRLVSLPGKHVWLRSDFGITLDGVGVSVWADKTGNTTGVAQVTAGLRPTMGADGAGGQPYLVCGASASTYMNFANNALSSLTAAEAFFVFKRDSDPMTVGQGGLHQITNVDIGSHIPYTNGALLDAFGTNVRKDVAGTTGITDEICYYNVSSKANLWRNALNGVEKYSTTSNSAGFKAACHLFGVPSDAGVYLQGQFYELLLFNRELSVVERSIVGQYIRKRYVVVN